MKGLLRVAFLTVLAAMAWVTWTASRDRSVLVAAVEIWNDPWGKATLFDAYFAFLTVWLWIVYREGAARSLPWLVAILTLGNFAIAGYFLWALQGLGKRPWTDLFQPRAASPGAASPGAASPGAVSPGGQP